MSRLDFTYGEYAIFIWPAFALTAVVLAGLVVEALLRARRWRSALRRLEREAAAKR